MEDGRVIARRSAFLALTATVAAAEAIDLFMVAEPA